MPATRQDAPDHIPLVAKLAVGMDNLTAAVADIREDARALRAADTSLLTKLTAIETVQNTMATNLTELTKLVRDGNGRPSMFQRLTELEVHSKHMGDEMKHMTDELKDRKATSHHIWATAVTLFVGVGSIIATCWSSIFK